MLRSPTHLKNFLAHGIAPAGGSGAMSGTPSVERRKAIVIGASTGGPQALAIVLEGLRPALAIAPIFVVQHIPSEFIDVIAAHLQKSSGLPIGTAKQGEKVENGRIYISPGNVHLSVACVGDSALIALLDWPAENFCKPSVDVLFRSAARCYGDGVVGIILTGMGSDGLAGSRAIVESGGRIIAQDAASSTVWGMPGAVANAGLAHSVLPVGRIAATAYGLLHTHHCIHEKTS